MAKRRLGPEQIVTKLRQIEALKGRAKASQPPARRMGPTNRVTIDGGRNMADLMSIRQSV